MHVEACRLVDGANELVFVCGAAGEPDSGVILGDLDLGFPEVRDVVEPRPAADGTYDLTRFHGDRAVTASVTVLAAGGLSAASVAQQVRGWCHPARRPYLHWVEQGQPEKRMMVRASGVSAPLLIEDRTAVAVQLGWRAPGGRADSVEEHTVTLNPAGAEEGRTYPLVFARAYPLSTGVGTVLVDNAGNADAYPTIRIFGPVSGPRVENRTTGERVEFTVALNILAGEYLDVDLYARTAQMYGSATVSDSRLSRLNFTRSSWWSLVPGPNAVRFYPLSAGAGAQARLVWRDAWL